MYWKFIFVIVYISILMQTNAVNNQVSGKSKCSSSQGSEGGKDYVGDLSFQLSGSSLNWPCESTKNIYTQSGRYVPRNVIITRAQLKHNIAYVAMPRYKLGVPNTIGKITLRKGKCMATIEPYPCWAAQEEGNCQAFQSVVDIALDKNGLLWALDVGIVNTLEQPIKRCPPKLVAINTATGKVVKSIDLSDLVTSSSRLQFLVVDYSKDDKPFVYVADAGARSILVYDITASKSYRVVLPKAVATETDVLYMTLVRGSDGETTLFFTYLTSNHLYSIKTQHLHEGKGSGAIMDVGQKPYGKQIVLLGSNGGSNIFLRYKGENDIYMWNTESCFKASNFEEVLNGDDCRLATQVLPGHKRFMWSLSSNFHHFIANTVGCNGASVELRPLVRDCDD